MDKIRFALPKGHLAKATFETIERAGYDISNGGATYRPKLNDSTIELKILRPQEIPIFVAEGLQDLGITGTDWLRETHANVSVLLDLEYSKVRIVVAVPKNWERVNSLSELLKSYADEGRNLRVSTEYLNISAEYLKKNSVYKELYGDADPTVITPWWKKGNNDRVSLFLSFGATEAKPPENADAIIDVIETGSTLEENELKIIEEITDSTAILIANKEATKDPAKKEKISDILTLLRGVVDARKKIHIFVNVRKNKLDKLLSSLPALKKPTISPLSDKDWCSVNTVIEKDLFLDLLPILRRLAQGLVVYEPRQVLPFDEIDLTGEERSGL